MSELNRACLNCRHRLREKRYAPWVRCMNPKHSSAIKTDRWEPVIYCHETDRCDQWEQLTRMFELDDVLNFGKFKGTSVAYIAEFHKDYFMWLVANNSYAKFSDEVWALFVGDDGELEEWRSTTVAS